MSEFEISDTPEEIAVIGLVGRFPGASDLPTFWANLRDGKETLSRFAPRPDDPAYVPARGVLEGAGEFDPAFFGINPNEALITDPQQRVFLECAWEALESAGYDPKRAGGAVGVYAGMSNNTYLQAAVARHSELAAAVGELQTMMGNEKDYLATRVAYKLDLKGPALSLYTACSTSLVAVSQACAGLLGYQCDLALAGGVSITFPLERGYRYQEGGILSPDGHCRTFDARAQGTVFSSGVGIVVLKRLSEALADGDTIHAVIKGAALNNDGAGKVSFTAPSVEGHAEVISLAQALAGVEPQSISYIEAHGTATPLGDPIELAGLTRAFRAGTDAVGFCRIGSVKTNIGHLDAAAGIAGLIKTILALKHRQLPASLHFESPNPKLGLENSPFVVNAALTPWEPPAGTPRRAGVSSFGVGGTNAHVIVEEAPPASATTPAPGPHTLILSARTAAALDAATENLAAHLETHPELALADVAYTLAQGRQPFAHRRTVAAADTTEAAALLRARDPRRVATHRVDPRDPERPVAFLFPGQGAQRVDMGRVLYENEPIFRRSIDDSAALLLPLLDLDLRTVLYPDLEQQEQARRRLTETRLTQPALFAVEFALARLFMHWGVRPRALMGHSVGEYVAACLADVFSHADALALLATRARLMQEMPPGAMLAVRLSEDALRPRLTESLALAAINAPELCVVSGPEPAIAVLERELAQEKIVGKRLMTSHAFHSAMMDPVLPPFLERLRATTLRAPQIPIVSSRTGTFLTDDQATDPEYWVRQLREPVRFADGVGALLAEEGLALLEVGPGNTLGSLVRQHPDRRATHPIVATLGGSSDTTGAREGLGQLWAVGVGVDWDAVTVGQKRRRVPLPTYPFERTLLLLDAVERPVAPVEPPSVPAVPTVAAASPETPAPIPASIDRRDGLRARVQTVLHELSGIPRERLAADAPFLELGFDSLFLTQAGTSLQSAFGVRITFRQLIEDLSTIDALADYLDAQLPPDPEPVAAPVAPPVSTSPVALASPDNADPVDALERVIQQQLQIMAQQLDAIRGRKVNPAALSVPAPAPVPAPIAAPAASKSFGPYRPLERATGAELTAHQQAELDALVRRYVAKMPGSQRLTQEHRGHLADPRAVAGFRQAWKEMVFPVITARSEGAHLWDIDGNDFIDLTLGFGTSLFGHRPPFAVAAIEAQLKRGFEIGPQSPFAGQVARKLCELVGMDRAAFCSTGSEAVTAAIRMARTVTGRDRIALFNGAYHGQFDEVLVRPVTIDGALRSLPVAPGIPKSMVENVLVLEYGAPESLDVLRQHASTLAAVLVEPVQSRRPDLQPEAFLKELRRITEESGTALVFDEVVTGFRTHPRGVQGLFGIQADIATYGKVLGGGLPIGVVAGCRRFMDALDGGDWRFDDDSFPEAGMTFFAGTFVRHPLALASADAVLTHLAQNSPILQQDLDRRTAAFVDRVNAFCESVGAPVQLSRFSSMFMIATPPELKLAGLLFYYLRLNGLHIWEGRPGFLSTAHTDADIERAIEVFQESVGAMQEAGFLPGLPHDKGGRLTPPPPRPSAPALTDAQREVWLAARMDDDASCALNESLSIVLEGALDPDRLERALQGLVARHEALRTTFSPEDGAPRLAEHLPLPITRIDLTAEAAEVRSERIAALAEAEGRRAFDLAHGPLLRASLIAETADRHTLILSAHHLVCDGWSFGVLLRELGALTSGETLPPAPRFADYAERLERDRDPATEAFWIAQLTPTPPPLELPLDRPHPPVRTFHGGRASEPLGRALTDAVRTLSGQRGATLFTTLLTGLGTLLHRLTGQNDLVVGVPAAGQATDGAAELVGHCVHLLPIRLRVDGEAPFAQQLTRVRTTVLDAFEHPAITFGQLLPRLALPRESGRTPLVGVTFNLDRDELRQNFAGLNVRLDKNPRSYFQFDLGFNIVETESGLILEANFNRDVLDEATVRRWLTHYRTLLAAVVAQPELPLAALPLLTTAERHRLLVEWNATERPYPRERCVHELFAEQATRTPDAVAIEAGTITLTYAELEARAHRLAHRLRLTGVGAGTLVGICLERSPEQIVGLLAILKAGGAYVPLDPSYPAERLRFMIEDSAAPVLLTCRALSTALPSTDAQLVCIDGDPLPDAPTVAPESGVRSDSAAYVMYTSGSTGRPKGTVIPHRAINRLVCNPDYVRLDASDVVAQAATIAFDAATFEIWGALLNGARLLLMPRDAVLAPRTFAQLLQARGVTTLWLTTALFNEIVREVPDAFRHLRTLMIGGEALNPGPVRRVLTTAPPQRFLNGYGPTETTTFATTHRITAVAENATSVPIGRPIANTTVYVLDERCEPTPIGVCGELYIGGDGLAIGYHARPELTAQRFVAHPFSSEPGARLYRTGDLVRWLPDGTIDFVGRRDQQVKIRGFRIELGEIESALGQHPAVREALVTTRRTANDALTLVAYLLPVSHLDVAPTCREFRHFLETRLPSYLIPSAFVVVDAFPITANGKVDHAALPEPDASCIVGAQDYEAPRNETESRLAQLWQDVLDLPAVGIHDEFFAVGGHSLLAVRLFTRIEAQFGRSLSLASLFQAPTIAQQAALLTAGEPAVAPAWSSLVPLQTAGDRPVLYCVHHGYGDLTGYHELVRHLGDDQPIFGLQARGIDGTEEPLERIEDMAAHYIREIQRQRPHGPYHLTGFSLGGVIAFEMARQLRAAGHEVGMLALLDTYAPIFFRKERDHGRQSLFSEVASVAANILRVAPEDRWRYTRNKSRAAQGRLRGMFRRPEVEACTEDEGRLRAAIRRVEAASRKALAEYEPSAYDGSAVLFRAHEREVAVGYDPVLWWREVVHGSVEVIEIPGDHHAIIQEPGVRLLTSRLRECLDRFASVP
jgi:amino acid adenylation domain-containing protein